MENALGGNSIPEFVVYPTGSVLEPDVLEALNNLLPQLSSSAKLMTEEELGDMVNSHSIVFLIARESSSSKLVGVLTLAVFRIPTGIRAWIEDVIVDTAARGKGIGELLTRQALEIAKERGAKTVELTSRPSREAANRLYQRIGFKIRETNVYRYELGD